MTTEIVSGSKPKYGRGMNPNSRLNLRPPWKPGDVVPKNGGYTVTHRLKQLIQEESDFIPPNANPNDKLYRDQIARAIVKRAACGDVPMVKELLDRTEGKVPGDQPPPAEDNRSVTFVFVLPDGTRFSPKALIEGVNGNSNPN